MRSPLEDPGQATYSSTRRVFRIIDRVSQHGDGLTAKRLAGGLGISPSTGYHLISILVGEGYREKLPPPAGSRLGPMITVLHARPPRHGRRGVVEPILHELARRAGR